MKRSLVMCLGALLACTSVGMATPGYYYDQQPQERPRRVELPSFLGVELREVNKEAVSRLKLREERGALIEGVTSGSGAAKGGLQKDDVIVKWDGEPIESAREMSRHIRETPAGRAVKLTVMRDGREMEINVTLGERTGLANRVFTPRPVITRARTLTTARVRPDLQLMRLPARRHIGVELQSMTPQLAEYFGLSNRNGALVIFVFADSPAAKAGLKAGDVILSAGGETVEGPTDLRRVLSGKAEGAIEFKILRDKREQTLNIQLEKGTNSWLLEPDLTDLAFLDGMEPMTVSIPKIAISPMSVQVPAVSIKPMKIQVPQIDVTPMAIPQVRLAPMRLEIPKIDVTPLTIPEVRLAPMKLAIPKIQIEPMKLLIVPRRIVL